MKKSSRKNKKRSIERPIKICTLCEKPHKSKTQLCPICNKKSKELGNIIPHVNGKASISKLLWLKQKYETQDVFTLLKNKPSLYWDNSNKKDRLELKRDIRTYHKSDEYKQEHYKKWQTEIPLYIINEMKKHKTKELLTISGDKINPNIHYLCKVCNEEQAQKFNDIKHNKGHNCNSVKSTGEIIIEDYLKDKFNIKTQYDTLKCINPITKKQLPYDIEIPEIKTIIEIQGKQHLEYIEYFHGSIENFYYQQRKDDYKKRFAESKGYKVVYIYYDEIKNGKYKHKLNFYI